MNLYQRESSEEKIINNGWTEKYIDIVQLWINNISDTYGTYKEKIDSDELKYYALMIVALIASGFTTAFAGANLGLDKDTEFAFKIIILILSVITFIFEGIERLFGYHKKILSYKKYMGQLKGFKFNLATTLNLKNINAEQYVNAQKEIYEKLIENRPDLDDFETRKIRYQRSLRSKLNEKDNLFI